MRYESCPKQYYHINVIKDVKDEDTEFSADGKAIHQGLYRRICKGEKLPLNYRYLETTAAKFVGMPGDTSGELKFAVTRRFAPVQYFDPSVFVRVVVDLLNVRGSTCLLVDWKTGKPKSGFTQLELSAPCLVAICLKLRLSSLPMCGFRIVRLPATVSLKPTLCRCGITSCRG
jgi:hypothetical protein